MDKGASRHEVVYGRAGRRYNFWTDQCEGGLSIPIPYAGRRLDKPIDLPPKVDEEVPSLEEVIDYLEIRRPGLRREIEDARERVQQRSPAERDTYLRNHKLWP